MPAYIICLREGPVRDQEAGDYRMFIVEGL